MDDEERAALQKMLDGDNSYGNPFHKNCPYQRATQDLLWENAALRKENERLRTGQPLRDVPGVFS